MQISVLVWGVFAVADVLPISAVADVYTVTDFCFISAVAN
jgi:hypothetical protein